MIIEWDMRLDEEHAVLRQIAQLAAARIKAERTTQHQVHTIEIDRPRMTSPFHFELGDVGRINRCRCPFFGLGPEAHGDSAVQRHARFLTRNPQIINQFR